MCAKTLAGRIAHPGWIVKIWAFGEDLTRPRRLDLALTTREPSGYLGMSVEDTSRKSPAYLRRRRRRNRPGNAQALGTAQVMTLWKEASAIQGVRPPTGATA